MPPKTLIEDLAIRYGFQVLGALVIMVVGFLVARWVGSATDVRLRRGAMEPPMRILLVGVVRVVVLLMAALVALDRLGFQIAPFVAGIGVAGIGIGFALQGVLSNIVAGLTIIFTKPFRVGEYIEVAGVQGEVIHVDLPSTILMHADRSRVIVPNRKIVGEILHNYGMLRQLKLSVNVVDTADLSAALAAVQDVLNRNPGVLRDPAPVVAVNSIGDAGIRISVLPWVAPPDAGSIEGQLYRTLIEEFRSRNISMGVPRREIRVLNGTGVATAARAAVR
jgi:small conductance mechanosensitive channel